jgi:F0F1-type ATP synthase epsilon subunit
MLFLLNTPEYTNVQSNTTKVKVHLKNGVAEILDQHQDLMGRVENNIVEIETNFENKTEKNLFVLQDAVFIVSTKGLDKKLEKKTSVYVYAKNVKEINSRLDKISAHSMSDKKINKQLLIDKISLQKSKLPGILGESFIILIFIAITEIIFISFFGSRYMSLDTNNLKQEIIKNFKEYSDKIN